MSLLNWLAIISLLGACLAFGLWVLWLTQAKPGLGVAGGVLLLWMVLIPAFFDAWTTWAWWLTQEHTATVCTYVGSAGYSNGDEDGLVLGNDIYTNPSNLRLRDGEHWCGLVRYQNGAPEPWLVRTLSVRRP